MKKQLLLGSALLAAISAFPQQGKLKPQQVTVENTAQYIARKFEMQMRAAEQGVSTNNSARPAGPVNNPNRSAARTAKSSALVPITWNPFTASMNIYGSLVSSSRPLQYNDNLNAVSFIHRKSPTYIASPVPIPTAQSGLIVGMITQDWGTNWDSTLIWNSNTQWARYPQGGVWNRPGSIAIDSSYIIATGPITQANANLGWIGSYFASKKLDTLGGAGNDSIASTAPGAQQFITNSAPYDANVGKVDFPRLDFTVTDDGVVRSLGFIANNVNGTGPAYGWRGAKIVKGAFNTNTGTFDWSSGQTDSIIPDPNIDSGGNQDIFGTPHMTWNEAGDVGYVWFIGARLGKTGRNSGFQPIIFKTIDGGNSWNEMAGINFDDTVTFAPVLNHILSTNMTPSLTIPFFLPNEGIDATVDRNNRLHIVSTVVGTFSDHPDSLGFTYQLNHGDGQVYRFGHRPGLRPYIYDFTETPTGFNVTVIDSMSSEAPGETSGTNGYNDNPWDAAGGSSGTDKVSSDARIQVSRTPDGKYIVYTWAESDTAFTNLQRKWNHVPNVKARMSEVGVESGTVAAQLTVYPTEINVTNPVGQIGVQNELVGRAQMYYSSPKCAVVSGTSAVNGVAIGLPITVSNNSVMTQLDPNTHWYSSATLNFGKLDGTPVPDNQISYPTKPGSAPTNTTDVGVAENSALGASTSLYPNPASNSVMLSMSLSKNTQVQIVVMNAIGQVVKTVSTSANTGENKIAINLSGLSSGVYMVNVKAGDAKTTKKLVIQE